MKTLRLILLGAIATHFIFLATARAQYNARRFTRRIAPITGRTNATARLAQPPASAVATNPAPAPPAHVVYTQYITRLPQPPMDPEKIRAAKEEATRRAVEFQKKRADEGSESAQYELGVRYLKGDGVEKDEATGRKWLTLSAKNGYIPATKKLQELDRPAPAPSPGSSNAVRKSKPAANRPVAASPGKTDQK